MGLREASRVLLTQNNLNYFDLQLYPGRQEAPRSLLLSKVEFVLYMYIQGIRQCAT